MDTKITLNFTEKEMKWIEFLMTKYYGTKKYKTKKALKDHLGLFCSTMFNKGAWAIENDKEYIELQ